ncbi:MAG TPA: GNAT family N-acetyltransferase [Thermomicrobiales bacterium]|nr:GNAT family N-acetyltransferase [Thermomicrobiales bacterium]
MSELLSRLVIRRLGVGERPALGDLTAGGVDTREQTDCCSYVAEIDGHCVGYLLVQSISYLDGKPLTLWIDDLAVHPDHRRRKIATALYRELGTWARAEGVKAILTRIPPDNAAARALHQQIGFEDHATGTLVWRLDRD